MKVLRLFCLILIVLFLIPSCSSDKPQSFEISDNVMGSEITISLAGENITYPQYEELGAGALSRVRAIESAVSRGDKNSDLCRFNASEAGIDDADIALQCTLSAAFYACELTEGAFDPTIGTLTELWSGMEKGEKPTEGQISNALSHSGQSLVGISGGSITKVDEKLTLDLDSIGRGYALEKAICYLSNSKVTYGSCSFPDCDGFFGAPPEGRFTTEETDHKGRPFARLKIDAGYISRAKTGGAGGESASAVIDPLSGTPASGDLECVIVYSSSGALSDALSTALLVSGSARAVDLWRKCAFDFDAVLVTDGEVYVTGRFASEGAFELLNDEYKLKMITEK